MTDLKHCPFCGSHGQWEGKGAWRVICSSPTCEAKGPNKQWQNVARDAWNKRVD